MLTTHPREEERWFWVSQNKDGGGFPYLEELFAPPKGNPLPKALGRGFLRRKTKAKREAGKYAARSKLRRHSIFTLPLRTSRLDWFFFRRVVPASWTVDIRIPDCFTRHVLRARCVASFFPFTFQNHSPCLAGSPGPRRCGLFGPALF